MRNMSSMCLACVWRDTLSCVALTSLELYQKFYWSAPYADISWHGEGLNPDEEMLHAEYKHRLCVSNKRMDMM